MRQDGVKGKLQKVQRVLTGAFRNEGHHYDKTGVVSWRSGKTVQLGFAREKIDSLCGRRYDFSPRESVERFILPPGEEKSGKAG